MVEDLGIQFFRPYDLLLDQSQGVPWTRWFVGGSINLADHCLDRHARSAARDRNAVCWEGEDGAIRKLRYAELHSETCRLGNALKRLGIVQGERVGLFLPMVPEAAIAFLACAKIGAVVVPIFSGFGAQAVAARLNDCQAKAMITVDAYFRRGRPIPMEQVAAEAAEACPSLKHLIVSRRRGATSGSDRIRHVDWDDLVANESGECPSESLDPESPLMIAYTSGTTGRPRGGSNT